VRNFKPHQPNHLLRSRIICCEMSHFFIALLLPALSSARAMRSLSTSHSQRQRMRSRK
jgi:hypothetical protein